MKRKIIGIAAIVAIVLISVINDNFSVNRQSGSRSLTTIENIEAFAVKEGGEYCVDLRKMVEYKNENTMTYADDHCQKKL